MIYISSSCIKNPNIVHCVGLLAKHGVYHIELSGGTDFIPSIVEELLILKDKYGLNFLVHNYFPPPAKHFILNLASLDEEIWHNTVQFMKNAIDTACLLGSPVYGMHAGFYINPQVDELGKKIQKQTLSRKNAAMKRFIEGYRLLQDYNKNRIRLYVENNVLSLANYTTYQDNPFMLTIFEEYEELKKLLDFSLLFDVGHYKVTANVLKKDFCADVDKFMNVCEYIHVSDNDGKCDLHKIPNPDSEMYALLSRVRDTHKFVTLETYADIQPLTQFYREINLCL